VLLVLNGVYDTTHDKALNCINLDNASRLLFTTRIQGLLKYSAEVDVGVLSQTEALELILLSADMDNHYQESWQVQLVNVQIISSFFSQYFLRTHLNQLAPFTRWLQCFRIKRLKSRRAYRWLRALVPFLKFHLIKDFAARSEPGGFLTAKSVDFGSFENFVARQLHVNVRDALEEGQKPSEVKLAQSGSIVKKNIAMAIKVDCPRIKKSVTGPGASTGWSYTGSFDSSAID
jgi:hypothetical protein